MSLRFGLLSRPDALPVTALPLPSASTASSCGALPAASTSALAGTAFDTDVLIVGAGPAGLALAVALGRAGHAVTVLESQSEAAVAHPAPDGREIALTHRARGVMASLGLWQRLAEQDIAPLNSAQVSDGDDPWSLRFEADGRTHDGPLGFLVSNHWLRQVAWDEAKATAGVTVLCSQKIDQVWSHTSQAGARLGDGRTMTARWIIAADSRFSGTRRALGIGASSRDFGRSVIVARLDHDQPHDGCAHECFRHGNTLALLPLNGQQISAVVTVPTPDAKVWMERAPDDFANAVAEQIQHRLGGMRLAGDRHLYPLVAVYAHRFSGPRCALIGDAAVGMHPVTAHGYNFGLYGVDALTRHMREAQQIGRDPWSQDVLQAYDAEHRRVTMPIYLGTNALVKLYTDDRGPARMVRKAVLQVARRLPPVQQMITQQLTGKGHGPQDWLGPLGALLPRSMPSLPQGWPRPPFLQPKP